MKWAGYAALAGLAAMTIAGASPAQAATPANAASTPPAKSASAPHAAASTPAKPPAPVDINSASKAQLKTLAGIGDAEADKIIAGRPYNSKADLVTRNLIPAGVYQSNRHKIIALPPNKGKSAH